MEKDYPEYTEYSETYAENQRSQRIRQIIAAIVALLVLALLVWGIIWAFRALTSKNNNSKSTKTDIAVHTDIDTFAEKLKTTYTSDATYPTEQGLKEKGISPTNAYTYSVSATDGDTCDAKTKPCTRAVITSKLKDNKNYVVVLDKNNITKN